MTKSPLKVYFKDYKLLPLHVQTSIFSPCLSPVVAIVKVTLPRGVSSTDFISANYPRDFPDNQQMRWDFTVPGMHNYTVQFSDHTAPECLNGSVEVEYQKKDKKVTRRTLTDPQPAHQQGDFSMVLKNCQTNRTLEGLSLKYKVSLMRSGHPGTVLKHEEQFLKFLLTLVFPKQIQAGLIWVLMNHF